MGQRLGTVCNAPTAAGKRRPAISFSSSEPSKLRDDCVGVELFGLAGLQEAGADHRFDHCLPADRIVLQELAGVVLPPELLFDPHRLGGEFDLPGALNLPEL